MKYIDWYGWYARVDWGHSMIAFYPRDFYLVDIFQGYANGGLEEQNTNQYKLKMPFLSSRAILGNLQIQKPVQNLAFLKF